MKTGRLPLSRKGTLLKVVPTDATLIVIPRSGAPAARAPSPPQAAKAKPPAAKPRPKRRVFVGTRYQIEEELGTGGTGTVYKALDRLLNMPVALKVLNPDVAFLASSVAALKEEARVTLSLSHPHIVRLHDLQKVGMNYFLVMEYVEGDSFRRILDRDGPQPPSLAVQVVGVCSDALSYAHRHGVMHNDLKPGNLLLTLDGVLKIIDFGLAALMNRYQSSEDVVGTPMYMSPEQKRGELLDERTDVYALGLIAYELLTGIVPFPPRASPEDTMNMERYGLAAAEGSVRTVLEKAAAADRGERWPSVDAFSRAFAEAAAGDS